MYKKFNDKKQLGLQYYTNRSISITIVISGLKLGIGSGLPVLYGNFHVFLFHICLQIDTLCIFAYNQ